MIGALQFARSIVVIGSMAVVGGVAAPSGTPGDPIPDIDVTVEQHPGPKLHTHTDGSGTFAFTLPAGTYTLHIASKPSPSGAAMLRSPPRPGAANGSIVALPDGGVGGGYPYVLRLTNANVAITKVGFGVPVVAPQEQRSAAPASRDIDVTLTLGSPSSPTGAMFTLRGGVESRQ